MAPEQLLGSDVDARTDIFALGSVLYEMITGEKAFEGTSQASVITAILDRDSSTASRRVLSPPGVDRLVRKCLRKDPDERWQSARDLGDELRWLATSAAGTLESNAAPDLGRAQRQRRRFIFRVTIGFSLSILMTVTTFTILRHRTPPPSQMVAVVEPPATPAARVALETHAPRGADPNKARNDQDLQAARDMIAAGNYAVALRIHLQPLLERDPENIAALALKGQAEQTMAASIRKAKPVPKVETPVEVEMPGIARKAGEGYPGYQVRVRGLQVNLMEGKNALDKNEYAVALARFRLVQRDAPKYPGVDALIADATTRQQKAVGNAIDSGQQNETEGKLIDARRWYEQALQFNPSSVVAREKRAVVMLKMNQAAADLFSQATLALKTQNTPLAKRLFQEVYDQTMPGDEYREKAVKQLELLKR
jgi:tetratricopeptide (TPR) repeat protein